MLQKVYIIMAREFVHAVTRGGLLAGTIFKGVGVTSAASEALVVIGGVRGQAAHWGQLLHRKKRVRSKSIIDTLYVAHGCLDITFPFVEDAGPTGVTNTQVVSCSLRKGGVAGWTACTGIKILTLWQAQYGLGPLTTSVLQHSGAPQGFLKWTSSETHAFSQHTCPSGQQLLSAGCRAYSTSPDMPQIYSQRLRTCCTSQIDYIQSRKR